ncbi:MAG: hypothetical protein JWR40_788 [Massilia sp.]|nr:hypothetical protein [Massilia sp.]
MERLESHTSNEAAWRSRLQRHAQSGKSIAAFCRDKAVSTASFQIWRAKLAAADAIWQYKRRGSDVRFWPKPVCHSTEAPDAKRARETMLTRSFSPGWRQTDQCMPAFRLVLKNDQASPAVSTSWLMSPRSLRSSQGSSPSLAAPTFRRRRCARIRPGCPLGSLPRHNVSPKSGHPAEGGGSDARPPFRAIRPGFARWRPIARRRGRCLVHAGTSCGPCHRHRARSGRRYHGQSTPTVAAMAPGTRFVPASGRSAPRWRRRGQRALSRPDTPCRRPSMRRIHKRALDPWRGSRSTRRCADAYQPFFKMRR